MPKKRQATTKAATAAKQETAMRLRMTGLTVREIARSMGISPSYADKLIQKALDEDIENTRELAEKYRKMQLKRLEAVQATWWVMAVSTADADGVRKYDIATKDKASGHIYRIHDRISALLGINLEKQEPEPEKKQPQTIVAKYVLKVKEGCDDMEESEFELLEKLGTDGFKPPEALGGPK